MGKLEDQVEKIKSGNGFIAALDQSGGSTPKALAQYGVTEAAWSNDEEMFTVVHNMRSRIVTSKSFSGDNILGAILFENTMDRTIEGKPTPDYLWDVKNVAPFLKIDKGLADENDGVQLMKPNPGLDALLEKAKGKSIFGTKMRSVIKQASATGVNAIVDQQFKVGPPDRGSGAWFPIIEPEVDIHCPEKAKAESMLKPALLDALNKLGAEELVMLKLTLPETDNFYQECVNHPNVLRVVALSGGYSREEANGRLSRNNGVIASFSRALVEGLSAQQSDDEFDGMLGSSIASICAASIT